MDLLNRLNRWQRLWLLGGLLWLPGVVAIVSDNFPSEKELRQASERYRLKLMRERDAEVKKIDDRCHNSRPVDGPVSLSKCLESNRQERQNVHADYLVLLSRVDPGLERRLAQDLPEEQVRVIVLGAGLWIIPPIALYVLGAAIAWLRKRFRIGV